MITTAAMLHGEFVDRAQAGRGLPSIEYCSFGSGDRPNELARQSRNSRHPSEKVQRRALSRQNRSRRAFRFKQQLSGCDLGSVSIVQAETHVNIQHQKDSLSDRQTRHRAVLFGDDSSYRARLWCDK